jgi:hypothetical protein
MGDVALAIDRSFNGNDIVPIMGQYEQKLRPMVEEFDGFHYLEDDDGDEDENDYRLA